MTDAPERIWFSPDEGEVNKHGWAGVQSGKDRLYWEMEQAHHPEDDEVEYVRADLVDGYDYLLWFFQNADFGPADLDVRLIMQEKYELTTGKKVPNDLRE